MSAHVRERLSPYLDSELAAAERSAIEAHLAQCPACSRALEELALVDSAVAELALPEAQGDDAFAARVRARIVAEGVRSGREASGRRRLPAWTWAAAAALLVAVVTPLTLRELRPSEARPALDTVAPPAAIPAAPAAVADGGNPAASRLIGAVSEPRGRVEQEGPAAPRAHALGYAGQEPVPPPPAALPSRGATRVRDAAVGAPQPAPPTRRDLPAQRNTGAVEGGVSGDVVGGVSDGRVGGVGVEQDAVAAEPQPVPQREAAAKQELPAAGAPPAAQSARLRAIPPAAGAGSDSPARALDANEASPAGRLEERRPKTAEEWRRLREAWRELARTQPDRTRADDALVRAIEAAAAAWRASGDAQDERVLERDVSEYLQRKDAAQGDRVRRLLRETR